MGSKLDTISHGILLKCVSDLGVDGMVVFWWMLPLSDRSQKVELEDCFMSLWLPEMQSATRFDTIPHALQHLLVGQPLVGSSEDWSALLPSERPWL